MDEKIKKILEESNKKDEQNKNKIKNVFINYLLLPIFIIFLISLLLIVFVLPTYETIFRYGSLYVPFNKNLLKYLSNENNFNNKV